MHSGVLVRIAAMPGIFGLKEKVVRKIVIVLKGSPSLNSEVTSLLIIRIGEDSKVQTRTKREVWHPTLRTVSNIVSSEVLVVVVSLIVEKETLRIRLHVLVTIVLILGMPLEQVLMVEVLTPIITVLSSGKVPSASIWRIVEADFTVGRVVYTSIRVVSIAETKVTTWSVFYTKVGVSLLQREQVLEVRIDIISMHLGTSLFDREPLQIDWKVSVWGNKEPFKDLDLISLVSKVQEVKVVIRNSADGVEEQIWEPSLILAKIFGIVVRLNSPVIAGFLVGARLVVSGILAEVA